MNPICCAIYDIKAQAFLSPFFQPDLANAERSFVACISSGESILQQWPEDFVLYHLGDYDPRSGMLNTLEHPALVITGQSAAIAAMRLRRRGGELSGGSVSAPPEDSGASAERNKTLSDGFGPADDPTPSLGI